MLKAHVLTSLRVFDAVAQNLSFAEAARQLCVTPGAVSQQIRKLEEQLGCQLFSRSARQVQLTPEGRVLAEAVSPSLRTLSRAVEALQQRQSTALRLAATPSLAFHWLTPRLSGFQRLYPGVQVEISALDSDAIDVTAFDLAIEYGPPRALPADCEAVELMRETLVPVKAPDYLPDFDWQQIAHWRSAVLLHDSAAWAGAGREAEWALWFQRYCPQHGSPMQAQSSQQFYFNRMDMAVEAAAAGLGIALVRQLNLPTVFDDGRLMPAGPALEPEWGYRIVLPSRYRQSAPLMQLLEWLRQQGSDAAG